MFITFAMGYVLSRPVSGAQAAVPVRADYDALQRRHGAFLLIRSLRTDEHSLVGHSVLPVEHLLCGAGDELYPLAAGIFAGVCASGRRRQGDDFAASSCNCPSRSCHHHAVLCGGQVERMVEFHAVYQPHGNVPAATILQSIINTYQSGTDRNIASADAINRLRKPFRWASRWQPSS